jgi:hypothetical protein
MNKDHASRILAVHTRARRFGYAVLETSGRLLDSGVTRFASPETAAVRMAVLCKAFRPSVVVFRKESARRGRSYPSANAARRALRNEGLRRSIQTVVVAERTLRKFFGQKGKNGKYTVALLLVNRFPELAWKLPPRRKAWQPEPWSLSLFDALALGVAYIHMNAEKHVATPRKTEGTSPFAGPSVA